jgi:hypothetical protein
MNLPMQQLLRTPQVHLVSLLRWMRPPPRREKIPPKLRPLFHPEQRPLHPLSNRRYRVRFPYATLPSIAHFVNYQSPFTPPLPRRRRRDLLWQIRTRKHASTKSWSSRTTIESAAKEHHPSGATHFVCVIDIRVTLSIMYSLHMMLLRVGTVLTI